MATAKRKTEQKKISQRQYKGRVDYLLRAADKKAITELRDKLNVPDVIALFVDKDLKVSYKWDYDSDCYQLDVYRAYTRYADSGYMYTCRHTDITTCLSIALHVFETVFDWMMPAGDNLDHSW